MRRLPTPFEYIDHRQFLRDAIKSRGFSYRGFAEKHGEIISFNTLAGTLSKGRGGLKNKPIRNFSCEMLGRLGKALKLNDGEIDYLIQLKLENDAEQMAGPWGSAFADSSRRVLAILKSKQDQGDHTKNISVEKVSVLPHTIAEIIEFFPSSAKRRISKAVLLESAGILTRHGKRAGLTSVHHLIARLEGLLKTGFAGG